MYLCQTVLHQEKHKITAFFAIDNCHRLFILSYQSVTFYTANFAPLLLIMSTLMFLVIFISISPNLIPCSSLSTGCQETHKFLFHLGF